MIVGELLSDARDSINAGLMRGTVYSNSDIDTEELPGQPTIP